ncbi:hypothetical protein AMK26_14065 [Streptomyces sp. CB03234]|nr:hypothetical protein AMK26_14065 [Streptomyces sp. CB03234]
MTKGTCEMRVIPLLIGIGCLMFSLAMVKNHRGFADRMLESRINLAPGEANTALVFRVVSYFFVVIGVLATSFGVVFLIFS